jgi:glyoxylase-like metal-dependent hydrolase (beta-lactamase superfamily II)
VVNSELNVQPVDLQHQGVDGVIGVYLLETDDGPALFDCGPGLCFERLRDQVDLGEVRHLLLSHIHLDHAGAAGLLVRENPGIQIHVSEIGLPHVVDPTRLIASARRVYGDTLDTLFGEPVPVPAENVHVAGHRELGLVSFPTPGHASHHVCYLDDEGTLFAGDACGVRLLPAHHVLPHAPPPDVDLEAWERTFEDILKHQPERLALAHFGVVETLEDVAEHVVRARDYLRVWSGRVERGIDEEEFVRCARHDYEAEEGAYDEVRGPLAAPFAQSYEGLERYWRKKREVA